MVHGTARAGLKIFAMKKIAYDDGRENVACTWYADRYLVVCEEKSPTLPPPRGGDFYMCLRAVGYLAFYCIINISI